MDSNHKDGSLIPRFFAGAAAPVFLGGAFLALFGEAAFARLAALGTSGGLVGIGVFVATLAVPCGLIGLLSPRAAGALALGVILPLGILAVDGVRLVEGPPEALEEPLEAQAIGEALRCVWQPVRGVARERGATAEPTDGVADLEARLSTLEVERDGLLRDRDLLRVSLQRAQEAASPEVQEEVVASRERIRELEAEVLRNAGDLETSRASVDRVQGMLDTTEGALAAAHRENEDLRAEIVSLKDEAQAAKDEKEHEGGQLRARIEALEGRSFEKRIEEIRVASYSPIGVVMEVVPRERGGGIAIRTSVDAARVSGPALVISPRGKPVAVIQCEVGRGEALSGRILFSPPRIGPTPGDQVFARVR